VNSATGMLTIPNIRKADEGNYTCVANNRAGKLEAAVFITVNVKPSIDTLENVTVLEGVPSVSLSCIGRGDPRPNIRWRKIGSK
jgi:roundabout axon guidance receptor 2